MVFLGQGEAICAMISPRFDEPGFCWFSLRFDPGFFVGCGGFKTGRESNL
jgi:hypothetical protein